MAIFFSADLHLGHRKMTENFKRSDGTPLRPFPTVDITDHEIITRFNSVIKPGDTLYLLGDLGWTSEGFRKIREINGSKIAVLGNHDRQTIDEYRSMFVSVHGALNIELAKRRFMLTHIPVHPDCVGRAVNLHGHLHSNQIDDPRYMCMSVERNDFFPFSENQVLEAIK